MKRKYFRILAPFTHIEDVKLLKDAGADELYCGYVGKEIIIKWPLAFCIINRRGEGQNFENYKIFRKAVGQANKYNLPVYVTVNGLYTSEQYPLLLNLIKKIERLEGIKGIIIADLSLLLTLKKNKFQKEIHISTGGVCFNSQTIDFYQNLGAERIILPRELTSSEIKDIIIGIKSKIDVEMFIILAPKDCIFIDGYCTFFHCLEKEATKEDEIKKGVFSTPSYNTEQSPKGCKFYFDELSKGHFKIFSTRAYKQKQKNLRFQPKQHYLSGCRICDLYDLKKYSIKSLKIIGRGADVKDIVKSVKLLSKALSYLSYNDISKNEYQRKCKNLFSKIVFNNKYPCTKFNCHFSYYQLKDEKQI